MGKLCFFLVTLSWLPLLEAANFDPGHYFQKVWQSQNFVPTTRDGRPRNFLYQVGQKESYSDFFKRLHRENCWKEWLIVIYMAADNDLSPYAERDIWEAEATGSSVDVDVVVLLDRAAQDGLHTLHIAKNTKSPD